MTPSTLSLLLTATMMLSGCGKAPVDSAPTIPTTFTVPLHWDKDTKMYVDNDKYECYSFAAANGKFDDMGFTLSLKCIENASDKHTTPPSSSLTCAPNEHPEEEMPADLADNMPPNKVYKCAPDKAAAPETAGPYTIIPLPKIVRIEPPPATHHPPLPTPKDDKPRKRKKPSAKKWFPYTSVCAPNDIDGPCLYDHRFKPEELSKCIGTGQPLGARHDTEHLVDCSSPDAGFNIYAALYEHAYEQALMYKYHSWSECGGYLCGGPNDPRGQIIFLDCAGSNGCTDKPKPPMTPQQFTDWMNENLPAQTASHEAPDNTEICGSPGVCRPLTDADYMRLGIPKYPPDYKMPHEERQDQ